MVSNTWPLTAWSWPSALTSIRGAQLSHLYIPLSTVKVYGFCDSFDFDMSVFQVPSNAFCANIRAGKTSNARNTSFFMSPLLVVDLTTRPTIYSASNLTHTCKPSGDSLFHSLQMRSSPEVGL